jgi:Flp pilus assembly pilin Flp
MPYHDFRAFWRVNGKRFFLSKLMPRLRGYIRSYRTATVNEEDGAAAVEQKHQTLERTTTMTNFSAFLNDETGAVTVDWVVLTAAIVGLGLVVFTFIQPAISNLASDIGKEVTAAGTKMKAADPSTP